MIRILALCIAVAATVPSVQAQGLGGDPLDRMAQADLNHDGVITRAEFLSWRSGQWSRLDRNRDNMFTAADLPPFARSRWDNERMAGMRARMDANHDGRISKAEFVNGPATIFDLADGNGDNRLTSAEIAAARQTAREMAK